tara:strand:- start:192 stop:773 length:582 start_codon:yes stop_codon:yes gene_type:complete
MYKAFKNLTPTQLLDLMTVADPNKYQWTKLHEHDEEFQDLLIDRKLKTMNKAWHGLRNYGGTKEATKVKKPKLAKGKTHNPHGWTMPPQHYYQQGSNGSNSMPMMIMMPIPGYPSAGFPMPYRQAQQFQMPMGMPLMEHTGAVPAPRPNRKSKKSTGGGASKSKAAEVISAPLEEIIDRSAVTGLKKANQKKR